MQKTILAVDYDHKTLEEIRSFFDGQSVDFLMAHDGSQALEVYKNRKPDLVLTSALLPKLNGFELCKKITAGELGEVRPVIMFSGIYKAEKYRKEAIVGCGAVDFLEKPLVQSHLLKVISNLFAGIPSIQTVYASEAPIPDSLQASAPPDLLSTMAVPSATADLLEVDDIFEFKTSATAGKDPVTSEPLVLESTLPETSSLLIPPESKSEIDAAIDAYFLDSDLEVQVRDQQIAEEIENELSLSGQSILEIEAMLGPSIPAVAEKNAEDEIIDIEDALQTANGTVQTSGLKMTPPITGVEELAPEMPTVRAPSFTLSRPSPRNWIPIILIAVGVLAAMVLYWVLGK